MGLINIGTSGWSYGHWRNVFYPEDLPVKNQLPFYSQQFKTVEINSTFYRVPTENAIKNWEKLVPEDFIFAIKANRSITHIHRLKDYPENAPFFLNRIVALKNKLGPILFQLPPSFKINLERLKEFVSQLPADLRYTFEFRHPTWYVDEVYSFLEQNRLALCLTDLNGSLSPLEITTDLVYIRLHGPKSSYRGSYSDKQLEEWRERIANWSKQNFSVFCFFDNDEKAYATKDAERLKKILA